MKSIDATTKSALVREVPELIEAVTEAKKQGAVLLLTLDAFAGEPELLYRALWYAYSEGVDVTIVSTHSRSIENSA